MNVSNTHNYSFDEAINKIKNIDDIKRTVSDYVEKLIISYQNKQKITININDDINDDNCDTNPNKKIRLCDEFISNTDYVITHDNANNTNEINEINEQENASKKVIRSSDSIEQIESFQSNSKSFSFYRCNFCDYTNKYKHHLVNHYLRHHTTREQRIKNYKHYCKSCDIGFNDITALKNHLNTKAHTKNTRFICL